MSASKALPFLSLFVDFVQQIGMPIQHLEQFDQGQRRLGLAILIAGKGVNPTTKLSGIRFSGRIS
ncbi:hypothetical protein AEM42_04790 [Betaproteobacteria bacterium UKL13-2]|nr:hypothetical protein AEM42_04790 [Betaproteobacteria bacterium UKL13-2]